MAYTPDREKLAWAAGFFDGEGYVGLRKRRSDLLAAITINQVDREALERFQEAVGVGTINGPHARADNGRPIHRYQATGARHVQHIVAVLWPWLGSIKREQAIPVLEVMHWERPAAGRTKCNKGHPYEGNRTKYGQCRACMRDSDLKRRPRLKAVS